MSDILDAALLAANNRPPPVAKPPRKTRTKRTKATDLTETTDPTEPHAMPAMFDTARLFEPPSKNGTHETRTPTEPPAAPTFTDPWRDRSIRDPRLNMHEVTIGFLEGSKPPVKYWGELYDGLMKKPLMLAMDRKGYLAVIEAAIANEAHAPQPQAELENALANTVFATPAAALPEVVPHTEATVATAPASTRSPRSLRSTARRGLRSQIAAIARTHEIVVRLTEAEGVVAKLEGELEAAMDALRGVIGAVGITSNSAGTDSE